MDITRYKQDKDIDIDKYIDINIMYKYIIFFGVMFKNIIREAKTLRGRGLGVVALGIERKQTDWAGAKLTAWGLVVWGWRLRYKYYILFLT